MQRQVSPAGTTIMANILDNIVADKREWLQTKMQQQPLASFIAEIKASDRDFIGALNQHKTAFILECKKGSPSKGLIREPFDLNYIASVYSQHASVISVLSDKKYFLGDFDFVSQVRSQVTQPVLCKDFFVDEYQVYLARHHQADAILLMLSVLNDEEYKRLYALATELKMGVLTEISNTQELERAIKLGSPVIGINNRDLRDLSTDIARTFELAPLIPEDRIIISESGIYNHEQVKQLSKVANGFLVGSSLMAEDDLDKACTKLILGQNKVCGLTRPQDALNAAKAGAIFGGLIFVDKSPRCISIEQARMVMSGAPLSYVGVFLNAAIEELSHTANALGLSAVQLHGDEDACYINKLREALAESIEIWKAHGVESQIPDLNNYPVDRHLLDSKVAGVCGGTGQSFDWTLLSKQPLSNIMLAGGLSPENALQAASIGTIGLDFNSGVESSPGLKDLEKLNIAFTQIREY